MSRLENRTDPSRARAYGAPALRVDPARGYEPLLVMEGKEVVDLAVGGFFSIRRVIPTCWWLALIISLGALPKLHANGYSLRFYGNGVGDIDRVKIAIDPQVPVDVGGDFTIEWWMKATPGENTSTADLSGGDNWIYGNIIFDRDVFGGSDYGDYGISLSGGRLGFGVDNGSWGNTVYDGTNHTVGVESQHYTFQ